MNYLVSLIYIFVLIIFFLIVFLIIEKQGKKEMEKIYKKMNKIYREAYVKNRAVMKLMKYRGKKD